MKKIKLLFVTLLGLIASSAAAQNDLIFMMTFDANDYVWYTYDLTHPKDQQVSTIKVTEYNEDDMHQAKIETIYYYDFNNLLTGAGRILYSESEIFKDFPYVGSDSYNYSFGEDKRLISICSHGDFTRYFYDNSGRINKCVSYYNHSNTELEGATLTIEYADKTSEIIKSISYLDPENDESWTSVVKYNGNTLTIIVEGSEDINELEFKKLNNRWIKSREVLYDCTNLYNEEGLMTSSKYDDREYKFYYNQNGNLIKSTVDDAAGLRVYEFDYEYDSRNNWTKQWTTVDGKRSLSAERQYLYR